MLSQGRPTAHDALRLTRLELTTHGAAEPLLRSGWMHDQLDRVMDAQPARAFQSPSEPVRAFQSLSEPFTARRARHSPPPEPIRRKESAPASHLLPVPHPIPCLCATQIPKTMKSAMKMLKTVTWHKDAVMNTVDCTPGVIINEDISFTCDQICKVVVDGRKGECLFSAVGRDLTV